jgi:hypothetical protein
VKFGGKHLERFQKGVIFTIKIVMSKTIDWVISNAFRQMNILSTKTTELDVGRSLILQGTVQQNGIGLMRVGCGINDMLKGLKAGQNGKGKKNHVCHAINYSWRLLGKVATHKYTAHLLARYQHIEKDRDNGRVIIESVKRINETADVWCITVPGAGEFSLSNGAIVHNCDAFGLMAVVVEDLFDKPRQNNRIQHRRGGGSWMGS